jgi:ABC-type Zn uptake system ZnuABC Zn-binding protein ZnuA
MKKYFIIISLLSIVFISTAFFIKTDAKQTKNLFFASNPAIASLVKAIVGDFGKVKVIGFNNGNFHNHVIQPDIVEELKTAKILFFLSKNNEPFLYGIINKNDINSADIFDKSNVHFWLSALETEFVLDSIFQKLILLMPEKKIIFENNYKLAKQKLINLPKYSFGDKIFFGIHDAYHYLKTDYKLNYYSELSDHHEHGLLPKNLSKMIDMSKMQKICLLFDINEEIKIAKEIKNKNINIAGIDSDGITIEYDKGIDGYIEYFIENINIIKDCI